MDYGTDMNSEWSFNEFGDLNLIEGKENLTQAIINRLSCDLHSLNLYYRNYGSVFRDFLGWKSKQNPLDFIKLEIEDRLKQEKRIEDFTVSCEYGDTNEIKVNLAITVNGNDENINLKITNNGDVIGN